MDPGSPHISIFIILILLSLGFIVEGTGVFRVHQKFQGGRPSLADLRSRDTRRHARILSAVDVPMGGLYLPTDTGKYYTEIGIGNPPKKFNVQIDTGSDLFWVRCAACSGCPQNTTIKNIELENYDVKASKSGAIVWCDDDFCTFSVRENNSPCILGLQRCQFVLEYGDGSFADGYIVKDDMYYGQLSGDNHTTMVGASVKFGCATDVSGDLVSSSEALDGIIGFGQSNSSMISQLASSGKVKKIFSHCLDGTSGGGIFAIGHVVQPKVNTTPLVPNMPHYNVNLKGIEVGGTFLQLPTTLFETGDNKGTIIDSGTTLAYLPESAYKQLMNAILSSQSSVSLTSKNDFECFRYTGSVDDGFPYVTFHFENSLPLNVYPHDYLFEIEDNFWCIGWLNGGKQSKDGEARFLLGDLVLSNKLVVYDLENQVIGWTDYNCSSSIKVQDDKTGAVYIVDAHDIQSSASIVGMGWSIMLLLTTIMCYLIF